MGRSPCCSKVGLRRGPWSTKEDNLLTNYIHQHGEGQWRSLPKKAGLLRCGKSCRLRWMNYLRPGIKRGNISEDEEDLIVRLHGLLGNRWSLIAGRLPGRTDNEIKNYWNTHLLKKLKIAGLHLNNKPTTNNKSPPAGKKKKKHKKNLNKQKNHNTPLPENKNAEEQEEEEQFKEEHPPPKTKVYLPKPIRVSSLFSRTNSYDSLLSAGASTSDGGAGPVAWPPLFDYGGGGDDDEFLGDGYVLPVIHHSDSILSSDVNMLEKVYDEYLQLL